MHLQPYNLTTMPLKYLKINNVMVVTFVSIKVTTAYNFIFPEQPYNRIINC